VDTATTPKFFSADAISALFGPVQAPTAIEIFETSRARLADAKLAPIEMFDRFANRLPTDGTPFLLVPPQPKAVNNLDWTDLMARIELNGKVGQNYLAVGSLLDLDPIVSVQRMLVGLEDGRGRLNTKPSVSEANITAAGRFGYTVWTGYIHVVVYTKVLNHHYMDMIRSRCGSDYVPFLYLGDDGPTLLADWGDAALPYWGAPSFGSVIEN